VGVILPVNVESKCIIGLMGPLIISVSIAGWDRIGTIYRMRNGLGGLEE
jgi:hypothetical protein